MRPIKKILCAVDFQDYGPLVAEYASAMAAAFGAEVVVVHVAAMPTLIMAENELSRDTLRMKGEELIAKAEAAMGEFLPNFRDVLASGRVVPGDPAEQILAQARESDADMIVMGTRGRKGIERWLFGSVAQEVVKSSPVPVLTIHPQD